MHLGTEEKAKAFFRPYDLLDVPRFADREGHLYEAFGLARAKLSQYLNLESVLRMVGAVFHGHFSGFPAGDVERMPGVFLFENGRIRRAFRHKLVSDRLDFLAFANQN